MFDIGTGTGIKIRDILHFIGRKKIKYKLIDNFTNEIQTSIANTDKLNNFLKNYKFISLESYLRKELKIRNVNNINCGCFALNFIEMIQQIHADQIHLHKPKMPVRPVPLLPEQYIVKNAQRNKYII